eukprot:g6687.t1
MNGEFNPQQADQALAQMRQQVSIQALTNMVNTMTQKCFEKCVTKPGDSLSSREQRCLDACVKNYQKTMMTVKNTIEKQV